MNLDEVSVEIRPRRSWESIDLGFRLARANALPLWGAWLSVFVPVALSICVLCRDSPWLAAFLLWWFKPWFDRVALHVLSRAVFGATPRVRETLRALPGMFRKGAIAAVLHMRFDAARSLNLALWQLEELPWARWRQRVRLIESPVRRPAGWLTATCIYFEATLVAAIFALAYWMIPPALIDAAQAWWFTLGNQDELMTFGDLLAWMLAVCVVEPFYVAAGFGLYLNRRTELEAWDIEIAFRRIDKQRLDGTRKIAA